MNSLAGKSLSEVDPALLLTPKVAKSFGRDPDIREG
jgi:hypothetical protein